MEQGSKASVCFGLLALHKPYVISAVRLAKELDQFAPGFRVICLTDDPSAFANSPNVTAIKHTQVSSMIPLNDKRFVIAAAFKQFSTVIFLDADSTVSAPLEIPAFPPGIVVDWNTENTFQECLNKFYPSDKPIVDKVIDHFQLRSVLSTMRHPCQAIFIVTKDSGRERRFLEGWSRTATTLDFYRRSEADGLGIGIGMALAGWQPLSLVEHFPASPKIKHLFAKDQTFGAPSRRLRFRMAVWTRRLRNMSLYLMRNALGSAPDR